MFKKILPMLFVVLFQNIKCSENVIEFTNINDIPWTLSRDCSEIDNDSFCVSVISFIEEGSEKPIEEVE